MDQPPVNGPRVLVVAPLYHTDRGGLGRQAVLLTERLARLGADPLVATRRMEGLPERAFAPEVEVVLLDAGRPRTHNYERKTPRNLLTSLRFSAGLLRTMAKRRGDYDVLHFHGASLPLLVALPWAKILGKRVVAKVAAAHQGVEAGDLKQRYGPLGPLMAWTLGHVDAYVATTAEIGAALRDEGYARIERLPNFVDTDRFRPPSPEERAAARARLGLDERVTFLSSGRLTERKGVHVLLDALARSGVDARLLVLGDGPERGRLEAQAVRLGVKARFLGFREDPERLLWAADAFVLPSRVEGLPNALLEAMASRLPVIATRIGGCLEAIGDEAGEAGLLVPPGDSGALAQALARLAGDAALRASLGAAAAERIAAGFTLEAIAPRYLELYRKVLRGP